ncbi:uncharacterized protein [Panulirus ornatus]|uniref:uncharacterized protein n=1 Tax=Panulirus ornatus TaxID=150431 RepID=UPI003A8A394A
MSARCNCRLFVVAVVVLLTATLLTALSLELGLTTGQEPLLVGAAALNLKPTTDALAYANSTTKAPDLHPTTQSPVYVNPSTDTADVNPTIEATDDVNPTTEAIGDVNPTTEATEDVNPTTEAIEGVIPSGEALEVVTLTTEALDAVIPPNEGVDEVTRADTNLNNTISNHTDLEDVVPTHTSPDDVVPTHTSLDDVVPIHTSLDDVVPTHTSLDDVVPTHTSLDDVGPTHTDQDDVVPTHTDLDEVPTHTGLDGVIPNLTGLDDVLPTHTDLDDAIPTHTGLDDVVPTNENVSGVTLTAEALSGSGKATDGRTSAQDRQHKLVKNDDTFATSLLMDIRDALYREKDAQKQQEEETLSDGVEQRLDSLTAETEDSIGRISSNFERLRQNMDEKVSLVLETFATLKLLVLNQGDHLRALQQRLQRVEIKAHSVELEAHAFRRSLDEVKSTLASYRTQAGVPSQVSGITPKEEDVLDPQVNTTESGEKDRDVGPSLDHLTSQMKQMTETVKFIKVELQGVQTNITTIPPPTVPVSAHQSLNHTLPSARDSASCLCPTDQLTNSIARLEEAQQQQQTELDELARNLTLTEASQQTIQEDSLLSQRLDIVEGFLTDLSAIKRQVNAVQEDVLLLKEGMGKTATEVDTITNATTDNYNEKGICVWPYKRGGGGCFYVHTDDRLNWQAAREHCRTLQGDLASPLRYSLFKLFILKQRLSRAYTYWLGASDAGLGGEWMWTDGRIVSPDVWETSQPDPRSAKCMALKPVYKFVASAEACRESRFFICQQERQL